MVKILVPEILSNNKGILNKPGELGPVFNRGYIGAQCFDPGGIPCHRQNRMQDTVNIRKVSILIFISLNYIASPETGS